MAKKEIPSPGELLRQIGALMRAMTSDLSCAILGTAFVDHCLASLLQECLAPGETSKELLQPGRPLGEYSARAKVAYSLGLIQKSILEEVQRLGTIRNKFAHELFGVTFSNPEIKSLCDKLVLPEPHMTGSRPRFIHSVLCTLTNLILLAKEVPKASIKKESEFPVYRRGDGGV